MMLDREKLKRDIELALAYDNLEASQARCGKLLDQMRELERENISLKRAVEKLSTSQPEKEKERT